MVRPTDTDPFAEARAEDMMLAMAEEQYREREHDAALEDAYLAAQEEDNVPCLCHDALPFDVADLPF